MPIRKESRLLRVGIVGAGPIAQIAHLEACRKGRNTQLYSLCEAAPDLLARVAAIHRPHRSFTRYADLLSDSQVEAVIVAVADQYHVELALQALQAGKHVLVEKPMGVTVEECEALRDVVVASGLTLQVGHNRRFDPGVIHARRFIQEEIGGLLSGQFWYYDSVHRYTMTDALQPLIETSSSVLRPPGNPKADRRRYLMLAHGSHLTDTTRFLSQSEIVKLRSRYLDRFSRHCWFVDLAFADGSLGNLELTITVAGDFEEGFRIQGEHGSVRGRLPLSWYHKSGTVECFSTSDDLYTRPLGQDGHGYRQQLEGWADTILHGKPQWGATVHDGLATMRAMAAIAHSAATGGDWVELDSITGGV
ncbi:MAG: Gfo/Idh/MocA family oxidoreductase [Caldilineaceae bacterium SB0675_bin_29]|uniref:Gfo/Idh/MocA family oxidoreductase n=1 Tax=Caldilineaceae bacterium SB0675_bin_29 TaxID=2605266 RepID=A0A6B1G0I4_9CHLR|nr:Gfo/Idh/MocA family oxidoreductase [Caldilineaceae bacterium SB0675_bin_29]